MPKCEDKNECDAFQCDFKSTECENLPGSHHCKCKKGFTPNLDCRQTLDLGLADGGIADAGIEIFKKFLDLTKIKVRTGVLKLAYKKKKTKRITIA